MRLMPISLLLLADLASAGQAGGGTYQLDQLHALGGGRAQSGDAQSVVHLNVATATGRADGGVYRIDAGPLPPQLSAPGDVLLVDGFE